MRRKENLTEQKGVTMYMTEYEWKKRQKKNSSSSCSKGNYNGQTPQNYLVTLYGGQAGSMGPSFTDVDWSLSTF